MSALFSFGVCLFNLRSCWAISERPSAGTRLLGYLSCVGYVSAFCATGGGSRSGGVLVPLGTAVPWGDSPRVQGGPWAPPPCGDKSSETLLVLYLVFVRFLWDGCWVFCVVFFVSGVGLLSGFFALKDLTLVCPDVCGPLSLSLCLVCSSATFFSLSFSLSLSQALGKPKPRVGFGIPLVTLLPGRGLRLRPVPLHFSFTKASPRTCVFFCFFFFRRSVAGSVFFSFLVLVLVGFSGGGFGSVCLFCISIMMYALGQCNAGRPAAKAPHPLPLWIKPSRVTRLLLGVDPGTV